MSKHIKLEDAINKMDEWFCEPYTPTELLSDLPTIDIVHCKECNRSDPNNEGDYDCKCHIPTFRVPKDGYCNFGERIDNE